VVPGSEDIMSTTVNASIDVDVPVRAAYDQWTQFESFPEFLGGVDSVTQLNDTMTHWVVSIGGVKREFDAEIGDQVPDDHVTWRSVGEVLHRGRVEFTPKGADATRVDLEIEWKPEGFVESAGAALQLDDMQVKSDLKRFKEFIERRGTATGAWRGEVHGGDAGPATGTAGTTGTTGTTGMSGASGTTGTAGTAGATGTDPDLNV
jgi:uncharacterized membrane protein